MRRTITVLAIGAVLLVAGCSAQETPDQPTAPTATTVTGHPTATTVSERLAHWQDVVQSMQCPELADLEQARLAVQFNDQTESLIAIHDRQAKLHCPQ
jgi:predicted outer membrane protein